MATSSSNGAPNRPPPPRTIPSRVSSEPSHLGSPVSFTVDVNPLGSAQIRWFYCEGKEWKPFCGFDSLSLEDARMVVFSKNDENMSKEVSVMGNMYMAEVFRNSVTIKPIYWDIKEPMQVRRGTWFEVVKDQWVPLPEDEAIIIEEAHRRKDWREKARADAQLSAWAQARSSPSMKVTNNSNSLVILHQVMIKNYEVVWIGDNEVLKIKKDIASRVLSIVGEKLGKGPSSYGSMRIMRGYKEHGLYSDCLPPIGHIVFVIHGICQNMESSDIVKSTSDVRDTCTSVAMKHFAEKWKEKRVEFIPIEWRTWLTLDKGTIQSITPHSIKSLRKMLNDSVLDVMYYMSPKYGPEILDGFRWQLNKKFKDFVRHHPDFIANGGTVSLFAHSLGSVLSYDLMYETCEAKGLLDKRDSMKMDDAVGNDDSMDCTDNGGGLEDTASKDLFEELHQARLRVLELEKQLIKKKTLNFQVDHLFAVGSPLGLFIMLKEHESIVKKDFKGASSFLPSCVCRRIHNLHHPSDPVAYRVEPLVNPLYSQIKPVKVDSAGSKPTQKSKDMAEGPRLEESTPPTNRGGSGWFNMASSMIKGLGSSTTSLSSEPTKLAENKLYDDDSKLQPEAFERTFGFYAERKFHREQLFKLVNCPPVLLE